MAKLTIDDIKKIKEQHKAEFALREGGYRAKITVHMGTCGIAAGARTVMTALIEEVTNAKLSDVVVTTSGCAGLCSREPLVMVEILNQPPVKYSDLNEAKAREIFKEHIIGGKPVEKYALALGCETTY